MAKISKPDANTFVWITSEPVTSAFITVDRQRRLYFNTKAREILESDYVMLGYDHANKRIIVGKPDIVRPTNVKPHRLDNRGYTSARPFLRALGLTIEDLPLRYNYAGRDYTVKGAYAFELVGDDKAGEDGGL